MNSSAVESSGDVKEKDSKGESVWRHPLLVAVLVAVVGLGSAIVTAQVTSYLQVSQYWRDKRLQVYGDFYQAVQDSEVSMDKLERLADKIELNNYQIGRLGGNFDEALVAVKASNEKLNVTYRPIGLLGSEVVKSRGSQYLSVTAQAELTMTSIYREMLFKDGSSADSVSEMRGFVALAMQLNSMDLTETLRDDLGVLR